MDANLTPKEVREADAREREAWKVAQLAATLCGGALAIGKFVDLSDAVAFSRDLLAESRRQVAASRPAPEGRPDAG